MGDILKGDDGKLGQDYMRAIVGAALAQTARMGVKSLVQEVDRFNNWPTNPLWNMDAGRARDKELTAQSFRYQNNYAGQGSIWEKNLYNKGMSTTVTMSKRKRRRNHRSFDFWPTNNRDRKNRRYFGYNKYS